LEGWVLKKEERKMMIKEEMKFYGDENNFNFFR